MATKKFPFSLLTVYFSLDVFRLILNPLNIHNFANKKRTDMNDSQNDDCFIYFDAKIKVNLEKHRFFPPPSSLSAHRVRGHTAPRKKRTRIQSVCTARAILPFVWQTIEKFKNFRRFFCARRQKETSLDLENTCLPFFLLLLLLHEI